MHFKGTTSLPKCAPRVATFRKNILRTRQCPPAHWVCMVTVHFNRQSAVKLLGFPWISGCDRGQMHAWIPMADDLSDMHGVMQEYSKPRSQISEGA